MQSTTINVFLEDAYDTLTHGKSSKYLKREIISNAMDLICELRNAVLKHKNSVEGNTPEDIELWKSFGLVSDCNNRINFNNVEEKEVLEEIYYLSGRILGKC